MDRSPNLVAPLLLACALVPVACGESKAGPGGGFSGVYTSVDEDAIALEFQPDGTVFSRMGGEQSPPGTFTLDGEKVVVDFNGQRMTFVRDGDCIEDAQRVFGKLCKGGKAGAVRNVSTRDLSSMRSGTWVAANADGEFEIEFQAGEKLRFTFAPAAGNPGDNEPQAMEGTYVVKGDTLYVDLADGTPVVLQFVNDSYESTAFGLPMKFVRP